MRLRRELGFQRLAATRKALPAHDPSLLQRPLVNHRNPRLDPAAEPAIHLDQDEDVVSSLNEPAGLGLKPHYDLREPLEEVLDLVSSPANRAEGARLGPRVEHDARVKRLDQACNALLVEAVVLPANDVEVCLRRLNVIIARSSI
jgi:hypothetical protein